MKILLFLIILTLIYSISINKVNAQTINEGNSSVSTKIINNVNGENCTSSIESIINGQKEVINSSECGELEYKKSVNPSSVSENPQTIIKSNLIQKEKIKVATNSAKAALPKKAIKVTQTEDRNLINIIEIFIKNFIFRFSNLI